MKCREHPWECMRYYVSVACEALVSAISQSVEIHDLTGLVECVQSIRTLRTLIGPQPVTEPWEDLPPEAGAPEAVVANTEVLVEEGVDS